ncbi:hypothetical protein D3C72_1969290 [compost metagenome]
MLMQLADHPATVVDFNLFVAGFAMQGFFVIAFDAQLADVVRRSVVGQLAVFIQAFDVTVVDLRHVADHMGQGGTVRVIATLVAFDLYAGEAELVNRKTRHLDFVQGGFHRNGDEAT